MGSAGLAVVRKWPEVTQHFLAAFWMQYCRFE